MPLYGLSGDALPITHLSEVLCEDYDAFLATNMAHLRGADMIAGFVVLRLRILPGFVNVMPKSSS